MLAGAPCARHLRWSITPVGMTDNSERGSSEAEARVSVVEREAFYTTAAQVIPILIIVLVIEMKVLNRDQSGTWVFDEVVGIYALILGEIAALSALYSQKDSGAARSIVVAAMLVGAVSFVIAAVAPVVVSALDSLMRRWPSGAYRYWPDILRVLIFVPVVVLPYVVIRVSS